MKKITLLLFGLLLIGAANAQSDKEEVDLLQSLFGMEKKALVSDFVKVDPSYQDAFWKLYDQYETARKELGKKRIALLNQYADEYDKMTNESTDAWMKEVLKITASTDNLISAYYKKIRKVTDAATAARFYHIENYVLTSIRLAILEEVPFVHVKK